MVADAIDRRRAALQLAVFTLAPVIPFGAISAATPRAFVTGTYTLTREVRRELRAGIYIEVVRRWAINFDARDDGFTVKGRQISAEVAAPPVIAALADLERQRDASAIFPIVLDTGGYIVRAGVSDGTILARGVDTARSLFRSMPRSSQLDADNPASILARISAMSAAAVSQLPRDLFFPLPGSGKEERTIQLPGGGEGRVQVTASAEALPRSGLLETSSREIVTSVAGQSREAREAWQLIQA